MTSDQPPYGEQQLPSGQQPPYFPPPQEQPSGQDDHWYPQPPPPGGPPPTQQFQAQPPQPPRQRNWLARHKVWSAVIGVAALFLVTGIIASVAPKTPPSKPVGNAGAPAVSVSAGTTQPTAAVSTPAASTTTTPAAQQTTTPAVQHTTTQAPPPMTASEASAIQAAESYLQTEPGWSYQGLIDQLDSPYGGQFSVADATFAVNNLSPAPNWDQQAAIAAQNYMNTVGGFSACSMVQQLDSPDGSEFTQAQAEYGAQSVGLGTC